MTVSEASAKQVRAYRYRFYPTPEQEHLLRRTLGCVRLVYNKAFNIRTEAWSERRERIDYLAPARKPSPFALLKGKLLGF
ncbi:MAG: helix-turn-helix domain-containing protein [Coleofasciculaceae cyanobacterium]